MLYADREIFIFFPCSADHEQEWQPYPVDPYSCYMCDHTLKGRTLPSIRWHTPREGICVGGVGLLDGEMETHTDIMTLLEGSHAKEYCRTNLLIGDSPAGMQQSK